MFRVVIVAFAAVLGGMAFYFARRFTQIIRCFQPRFPVWVALAVFALLMLAMIVGFVRPALPEALLQALRAVGNVWMGVMVYLLLFFVLSDAVVLLGRLLKIIPKPCPDAIRGWSAGVAAALALTVSAYGFVHAANVRTVSYDVPVHRAADMRIALISDLHLGAMGSETRLEKVVEHVNALSPDIICIAGDLFDNDFSAIRNPDRARELLGSLRAEHGVYACLGNHDAGGTFEKMTAFLAECGVELLNDQYVVIDNQLVLAGRVDGSPIGGNGGIRRKALADILAGAPDSLPVVVMDHNPGHYDSYGSEADLILSGHTHKGQIFPGSLITNRLNTVDYGSERPHADGPHIVVTSGAGTWGPPMRVGTDCEVVDIRLTPYP